MLIKLGRASSPVDVGVERCPEMRTNSGRRLGLILVWVVTLLALVVLFSTLQRLNNELSARAIEGTRVARALEVLQSWATVASTTAGAESLAALFEAFALRFAGVLLAAACAVSLLLLHAPAREALHRYFTESGSPIDLAVFRIVLFGYALVLTGKVNALRFAGLPTSLEAPLHDPLLPLAALLRPDPELMQWALWACRLSCAAALLGLATRGASCVAAITLFYVLGVPQLFGKVNHYHHVLWTVLILAAAPSGDAFSIDALWRGRKGPLQDALRGPEDAPAYALPLRLVWVSAGLVYFFPGLWKLLIGGSDWFLSDSLANHMRQKWYEDPSFTPLFRADQSPWLLKLAGLSTLVFELGFVFLIFSRRYRLLAPLSALLFHNLTGALMNIHFVGMQLTQLAFVPWSRLLKWTRERGGELVDVAPLGSVPSSNPSRSALPTALVGGTVVALVITYGALRKVSAWPFACYPTFDSYAAPTWRDLVITGIALDGREQAIVDAALGQRLGPERLTALKQELLRSKDDELLGRRVRAYWELLQEARAWPMAQAPARILVYRSELSLVPELRASAPTRLSLLYSMELPPTVSVTGAR